VWSTRAGTRIRCASSKRRSVRTDSARLIKFVRASDKADPLYEAVEVLLKGPEIDIARHGQPRYVDKDGHVRGKARVAWWREGATTLRELAVMDGNFTTESGEPYPALPDVEEEPEERSFSYRGDVPVFYGHYWRSGQPEEGLDYTHIRLASTSAPSRRATSWRTAGAVSRRLRPTTTS
jgi:hypothetical protein